MYCISFRDLPNGLLYPEREIHILLQTACVSLKCVLSTIISSKQLKDEISAFNISGISDFVQCIKLWYAGLPSKACQSKELIQSLPISLSLEKCRHKFRRYLVWKLRSVSSTHFYIFNLVSPLSPNILLFLTR